jgi:Cu+-exporting ATPase
MHRELSHADAVFHRPRAAGLYLLTALLVLLLAVDLLPFGREVYGVRFATIAAVLGGARVLYSALDRLLDGRLGADLALAIAVVAALLIREPLVAAEVVVIGLVGECLEAFTFGRTQAAVHKLVEVFPRRCWLLRDGQEVRVFTKEVQVGDTVVVKPGARIPVDGTVRDGRSAVDTSALTGESLPSDVEPGDPVLAGSVNQFGALTVTAAKVGEQTVAGRVIELTARALRDKAPVERTADRLAGYFLPAVLALAAITFVVAWGFSGSNPAALRRAVYPALSVLVVACPCALILATPAAIVAALGRLAGTGVLVKSGSALERLAGVRAVAFDKTGTLTEGRLELGDVLPLPGVTAEELLRVAATAERGSEHPLARVILGAATDRHVVAEPWSEFTALPGAGVRAVAGGHTLLAGTQRLLEEQGVTVPDDAAALLQRLDAAGQTPLLIARDDMVIGAIGARDRIRPEAAAVIADLRASGIEQVALLTGDRAAAARAVADAIGIDDVRAELLPDQKAEWVAGLAAASTPSPPTPLARSVGEGSEIKRSPVAFVGDGINDAPALARAAVGLAVGAGADIAAEAGDVVLMGDPLAPLPLLIRLSRQTVRVIRQNILVFAFGVNVVGIIVTAWLWPLLAPPGWFESGPVAGAIYHQIGSLAVLLNSMRLLAFERRRPVFVRHKWERIDQWLAHTFDVDEWLHWLSHRWRVACAIAGMLLLFGIAASGLTAIGPGEIGLVRRFGRLLPDDLSPGLHWRWPWPVETIERLRPEQVRMVEIGFRPAAGASDAGLTWTSPHGGDILRIPDEALLVTGDGNLVESLSTVRFHIGDPRAYLTAAIAPEEQLRANAEAVMRESIAARPFGELLTVGRGSLEQDVSRRLRERVVGLGLTVDGLTVHDLHPPAEVVDSYHAVARALEDRDRQIHEARAAATRTGRAAEAAGLQTVRSAEAQATERVALASAAAADFAAWHATRSILGPAEESRLAGELVTAIWAGRAVDVATSEYRQRRAERLAVRRSLTEFRLTWDALATVLGGRAKVIVDADRTPGRRQLLLFDPGPLPLAQPKPAAREGEAPAEPRGPARQEARPPEWGQ